MAWCPSLGSVCELSGARGRVFLAPSRKPELSPRRCGVLLDVVSAGLCPVLVCLKTVEVYIINTSLKKGRRIHWLGDYFPEDLTMTAFYLSHVFTHEMLRKTSRRAYTSQRQHCCQGGRRVGLQPLPSSNILFLRPKPSARCVQFSHKELTI